MEATVAAIAALAHPVVILYLLSGTLVGLIFGVIPGLGGVVALTLALPFTFGMNPLHAMFIYSGLMGSITFGGSISAILLNTPGTAHNAATCFLLYFMKRLERSPIHIGVRGA